MYDEHHSRAVSVTPNRQLSTRRSVRWSTVSKAALKSSNVRAQTLPSSIALVISSWTAIMAVSVEWCALYADWRLGNKCWDSKWVLSWFAATRSTTFDKKLRLDIGRKELTSSALSIGFFSRGRTIAAFKSAGNTPSRNDALQILASVSASSSNSRFINHVGAGSRQQCFDGALVTIFNISSAVTSSNTDSWLQGLPTILGGWHWQLIGGSC